MTPQQTYDLNRITTDAATLGLFEQYRSTPNIIDEMELPDVERLAMLLRSRKAMDPHLNELRSHCISRIAWLTKLQGREKLAQRDVVKLQVDLDRLFHLVSDQWKRIEPHKGTKLVAREIKAAGRVVGLAVNDLPIVQTHMYSVEALRNMIEHKSIIHQEAKICDEHFWSLYTYGGPKIVESARRKNWNMNRFIQDVYGYNQTVKTTRTENYRLAEYHKNHDLVTPQLSYTAADISPLVYCPKPMESKVMMMWRLLHKEAGLSYVRSPHKPFDHCYTFNEAVQEFPDLEPARRILRLMS